MTDRWQEDPIVKPAANAGQWQQDPIVRSRAPIGGAMRGFPTGVAQGLVGAGLNITDVLPDIMSLGRPPELTKAREEGRAELKRFVDQPTERGTEGATTIGKFIGGALPYNFLMPGFGGLGALAERWAGGPAGTLLAHVLAFKGAHAVGGMAGPVIYGAMRKLGLIEPFAALLKGATKPAARFTGSAVGGAVSKAPAVAGGAHEARRGDSDGQKAEGRRPEKPRKPPVQPSQPVARRSGSAEYRDNGPAAAERFDSRWPNSDDFRGPQSEAGEAR